MTTPRSAGAVGEPRRIQAEYRRREREIDPDRYAPWRPAVMAERAARLRVATALLQSIDAFPTAGHSCLEIGYGSSGWLPDLLGWGLRERDLHGIELDGLRAARARAVLPVADLRVGNAAELPWPDRMFKLVILSTVVSSIQEPEMRARVCAEAARVTSASGAVLWYDLRWNNPSNPHVRGLRKRAVRSLFPDCHARLQSVTLAPPLARAVTPLSHLAAAALESLPCLRGHLIGVLQPARQRLQ